MPGLPRGMMKGLLIGGIIAVLWGLLAERRSRTAIVGRVRRGLEAVPLLGPRVNTVFAGQLEAAYRTIAEDIVSRIRNGALMELGSSAGYLPVALGSRARDLQITTMDPSPYSVQISEARIHDTGLGRQVKVALGQPHEIPYPDEYFDAVVSVAALHGWSRPQVVLGEIHRVLRPGSRAWIYDLRKETPEAEREALREMVPLPMRPVFDVGVMGPWEAAYSEGEIGAMIAGSPFSEAEIEAFEVPIAGQMVPAMTKITLRK